MELNIWEGGAGEMISLIYFKLPKLELIHLLNGD